MHVFRLKHVLERRGSVPSTGTFSVTMLRSMFSDHRRPECYRATRYLRHGRPRTSASAPVASYVNVETRVSEVGAVFGYRGYTDYLGTGLQADVSRNLRPLDINGNGLTDYVFTYNSKWRYRLDRATATTVVTECLHSEPGHHRQPDHQHVRYLLLNYAALCDSWRIKLRTGSG